MKVLFIILGILALLTFGGLSAALGMKNANDVTELEKVEALGMGGLSKIAGLPDKSAFSTAMMLDFVAILIFLFAMVALFLKNGTLGMVAAGLTALTGILVWVLQPDVAGRQNGKPIAMVAMIAAIIAAASIYMVQNANKKKAANG